MKTISKTGWRMIFVPLTLLVALLFAAPLATAAPATSSAAADCSIVPYGDIGARHRAFGGNGGALGCALNHEHDVLEGQGRIQDFEHGIMTWSPTTGPHSVQTVWRQNGQLLFDWYTTYPLNYDAWLFNVRLNGQDRGLDREYQAVWGIGRSDGRVVVPTIGPGVYRVTIEGCDISWTGSHTCRQGWTNPMYIWF